MENSTFMFELPALKLLENEHSLLRYYMQQWHPLALRIEENSYRSNEEAIGAMQLLRERLIHFTKPLNNHHKKEEQYVFPSLIHYVGNEQGPVRAIEEEHEEINTYIEHFLHHSQGDLTDYSKNDLAQIAKDACELFEIITFHLVKEESVIFPMVETILNDKEQYSLLENLYSSII